MNKDYEKSAWLCVGFSISEFCEQPTSGLRAAAPYGDSCVKHGHEIKQRIAKLEESGATKKKL